MIWWQTTWLRRLGCQYLFLPENVFALPGTLLQNLPGVTSPDSPAVPILKLLEMVILDTPDLTSHDLPAVPILNLLEKG